MKLVGIGLVRGDIGRGDIGRGDMKFIYDHISLSTCIKFSDFFKKICDAITKNKRVSEIQQGSGASMKIVLILSGIFLWVFRKYVCVAEGEEVS